MSDDDDFTEESELDFWREYKWHWESPEDVALFVGDATDREVFLYAWGALSDLGPEDFYSQWWVNVQTAIKTMAETFSTSDLKLSLQHLFVHEFILDQCDDAIFDALLKYVPGFPKDYPVLQDYLERVVPDDGYHSDWWEYSWYPFKTDYLTWTFWGPETLARSTSIHPKFLTRIFKTSALAAEQSQYKVFRARVALASNPICPSEIIDFLWENRASADWLLRGGEPEESGVLVLVDGRYSIDEDFNDLEQSRDDAAQILNFDFPSDENWESSPGAQYVKNLFDIEWQAEDATTCLLVAFAKNSSLTPERYHQLHKEKNPLVRYFLSKNPSIPIEIEKALEAEHPTLSFRGYDEKSSGAVDGDLLGDVWFDLGGSK